MRRRRRTAGEAVVEDDPDRRRPRPERLRCGLGEVRETGLPDDRAGLRVFPLDETHSPDLAKHMPRRLQMIDGGRLVPAEVSA